jgi:hypothetical protein
MVKFIGAAGDPVETKEYAGNADVAFALGK